MSYALRVNKSTISFVRLVILNFSRSGKKVMLVKSSFLESVIVGSFVFPILSIHVYKLLRVWISLSNQQILKHFSDKQKVHGPHRSSEKQFQSINTFLKSCDYTLTLIKRGKKNWMFLICKHLNPLYPRMLCAKFGWNWPSVCGEEVLYFVNVFLLFRLGKGHDPSFEQT